MHFGGVWCPVNSKPIARAKSKMAEFLFNHSTYQFPKLKIHLQTLNKPLAAAHLNSPEQAQSNPDGTLKFQYRINVYDSRTAVTEHIPNGMFRMVASSLKAGYIFYRVPGPIETPLITPTMAWNKLEELSIGPILEVLGIIVDTKKMEV
jgi:hypothetical protein